MPVKRYVKKGVVFTPQALSSMGKALEETTEILRIRGEETKRRNVARFIIGLAQEDNNLDGAALRDRAVAALGGVAYCAVPGPPQPPNLRASAELTEKRWILHDGEGSAP